MKFRIKFALYVIGGIILLGSLYLGFQKKHDSYWLSLEDELFKEFHTLQDTNLLQFEFNKIQRDTVFHRQSVKTLLIQKISFFPTMEFSKFYAVLNPLKTRKKVTILGIPGGGNTTYIATISRFISASEERELTILCAPGFEIKMNEKYIGSESHGKFIPGELVRFIEKAKKDSLHNYVVTIDNIDKISPESFYGPVFWNELEDDDDNYNNSLGDYEIKIPTNLYFISVAHSGITAEKSLTDEHYRRIGHLVTNYPSTAEYILNLRKKYEKGEIDLDQFKKLVYFFNKTNKYIAENYTVSHTLGQWSSIRKMYKPEQFEDVVNMFIANTNALKPNKPLKTKQLKPILSTIENNGLIPGSSPIAIAAQWIVQLGFFTEFLTGLIFIISSSLIGRYLIRRKKKKIKTIINAYKSLMQKDYLDECNRKKEIDELIESVNTQLEEGHLNLTEANYLLTYIRNRMN